MDPRKIPEKKLTFQERLMLKRCEVAGFDEVFSNLTGNDDSARETLDASSRERSMFTCDGQEGNKFSISESFDTAGQFNSGYQYHGDQKERSENVAKRLKIKVDTGIPMQVAVVNALAFSVPLNSVFLGFAQTAGPVDGKRFAGGIRGALTENVFNTVGNIQIDHTQKSGLSVETIERVKQTGDVYKMVDDLIKLYDSMSRSLQPKEKKELEGLLNAAFDLAQDQRKTHQERVEGIVRKIHGVYQKRDDKTSAYSQGLLGVVDGARNRGVVALAEKLMAANLTQSDVVLSFSEQRLLQGVSVKTFTDKMTDDERRLKEINQQYEQRKLQVTPVNPEVTNLKLACLKENHKKLKAIGDGALFQSRSFKEILKDLNTINTSADNGVALNSLITHANAVVDKRNNAGFFSRHLKFNTNSSQYYKELAGVLMDLNNPNVDAGAFKEKLASVIGKFDALEERYKANLVTPWRKP